MRHPGLILEDLMCLSSQQRRRYVQYTMQQENSRITPRTPWFVNFDRGRRTDFGCAERVNFMKQVWRPSV